MKGTIAGLLIGVGLLVGGALVFLSGLGQPMTSGCFQGRCALGNLPVWIGVIMMIAGLAALAGVISVGVGIWEGRSDQPTRS